MDLTPTILPFFSFCCCCLLFFRSLRQSKQKEKHKNVAVICLCAYTTLLYSDALQDCDSSKASHFVGQLRRACGLGVGTATRCFKRPRLLQRRFRDTHASHLVCVTTIMEPRAMSHATTVGMADSDSPLLHWSCLDPVRQMQAVFARLS